MAADRVLSRELKALQEELSAARQERVLQGPAASGTTSSSEAAPAGRPKESAEESELRDELRDLVKEIADFAEDAEQTISAHPAMSIVAAMLLGILIGSMLRR